MTITDDEFSVLMIAARGEYMLAIGRWEAPCKALAAKGMMQVQMLNGGPQYTITEAGRAAIQDREKEEDRNWGALIEAGSRLGAAQKTAREHVEAAAQAIAKAAKAGSAPGDTPESAARKWMPAILERALDIINHG